MYADVEDFLNNGDLEESYALAADSSNYVDDLSFSSTLGSVVSTVATVGALAVGAYAAQSLMAPDEAEAGTYVRREPIRDWRGRIIGERTITKHCGSYPTGHLSHQGQQAPRYDGDIPGHSQHWRGPYGADFIGKDRVTPYSHECTGTNDPITDPCARR